MFYFLNINIASIGYWHIGIRFFQRWNMTCLNLISLQRGSI